MRRISIGRSSTQDYVVNHVSVSRQHAELKAENGVLTLHDLGSANGTFVIRGSDRINIQQADVKADDDVFFGDSGPHKIRAILYACRESTEIKNPLDPASQKTKTSMGRIRCRKCGAIMPDQSTLCTDCGGMLP
jgi:predicted component of type VI protein secretion system